MKRNLLTCLGSATVAASMSLLLMASGVDLRNLAPAASLTTRGTVEKPTGETAYGRNVLETWKRAGVELPLPEEQILRLKPGRKRLGAAPEADVDSRLRFTGFLQYSNVGGVIRLPYGFYTFSPADGLRRSVYKELTACINGGGVYDGNTLYGMSAVQFTDEGINMSQWGYYQWDTDTWVENGECGGMNFDLIMKGADLDPVSGKAYGVDSEGTLYQLDYPAARTYYIGKLPNQMVAFAISNEGTAYGISRDGALYSITLQDASAEKIGDLDFVFYAALQSMTFDRSTNKCYLAASEGNYEEGAMYGRLCEVNLTDATTRLIGYFPDDEEYTVLHVLYTPEDAAPAAAGGLKAVSAEGGGEAEVSFLLPSVSYDGSALAGDLSYELFINDSTVAAVTGKGVAGSTVVENVSTADGRNKFVVVVSNEAGKSERTAIESWGGVDNPAVNGLALSYDEASGIVRLEWIHSSVGENGGYADMSDVTYSVFRYPDMVMVADGIGDTVVTDDLSQLPSRTYSYVVHPVRYGRYFKGYRSDSFCGGAPVELPYRQDFESEDAKADVWILDSNSDGKTWEVNPDWKLDPYGAGIGVMWNNGSAYNDGDDWAIFPAVRMEEGMTYIISLQAWAMGSYVERFEVAVGEGLDPASYEAVVAPTDVDSESVTEIDRLYVCRRSGVYRVGIHGISSANRTAVVIDNVSIEKGYPLASPSAPDNVVVTPGSEGELTAEVSFDAPTLNMNKEPLALISRIALYRGEGMDLVGELKDVRPGARCVISDPDAMNGLMLYTVVASNESGDGQPASASAYVGIDAPTVPMDLDVADNLDGSVTFCWKAPVAGVNGGWLDPSELLYTLYKLVDGEPVAVASDIEDESYRLSGLPTDGEQAFGFYFVSASNDVAQSNLVEFPAVLTGAPYTVPFMEGFVNGNLSSIWRPEAYNAKWYLYSSLSTDGDGCMMGVRIDDNDALGRLSSGKISIKGVEEPKLALTFYAYPGADAAMTVEVGRDGKAPSQVLGVDFKTLEGSEGFRTLLADLTPFKGSDYITLVFNFSVADCEECPIMLIDDVNVRDVPQANAELTLSTPYKALVGEPMDVALKVFNVGLEVASGAEVELYLNDVLYTAVPMPEVAPFDRCVANVEVMPDPMMVGRLDLRAELRWNRDMMDSDNSAASSLNVAGQMLGVADGLVAVEENGMDRLSWDAPQESSGVTEGFEAYDPFNPAGFGDWKVVDGDGMSSMSVLNVPYPGDFDPAAFVVADFEVLGYPSSVVGEVTGHTGSSFAMCVRPNSLMSDDWLISPLLTGEGQTLTFWAKSIGAIFGESLSVLWSDGSEDVAGFESVASFEIGEEYTEYTVELPAGARRFALHCDSFYGGMLMVDDITFAPARTLEGYNVYCNGVKVGYVAAPATEWSVKSPAGDRTYAVTAVYAEGESDASAESFVSGVRVLPNGVKVAVDGGSIVVAGAEDSRVAVVSADGKDVWHGTARHLVTIPVVRGVYVVTVDGVPVKVMVK